MENNEEFHKRVCRSLEAAAKIGIAVAAVIAALSLKSCVEVWTVSETVSEIKDFILFLHSLS